MAIYFNQNVIENVKEVKNALFQGMDDVRSNMKYFSNILWALFGSVTGTAETFERL